MQFDIPEEDRQLILLSLALCVRLRPGFYYACSEAAKKLDGSAMFEDFGVLNTHIKPQL